MKVPINTRSIQSRMKQLSITHRVLLERGLSRTITDSISKEEAIHIDGISQLATELRVNPARLIDEDYYNYLIDDIGCHVYDSPTQGDNELSLLGEKSMEDIKSSYIESHRQQSEVNGLHYIREDCSKDVAGHDKQEIAQIVAEVDLLQLAESEAPKSFRKLLAPRIGWLASSVPDEVILEAQVVLKRFEESLAESLVDLESLSNQVHSLEDFLRKAERNSEKNKTAVRDIHFEVENFKLFHLRVDRPATICEERYERTIIGPKSWEVESSIYTFMIKPTVTTHLFVIAPKTAAHCTVLTSSSAERQTVKEYPDDIEDGFSDLLVTNEHIHLFPSGHTVILNEFHE